MGKRDGSNSKLNPAEGNAGLEMHARDLHVLAKRIHGLGGPAACRSAISRGYYYAFHSIEPALRSHFRLKRNEGHKMVPRLLQTSNDETLKSVGSRLDTARADRNEADYDLNEPRPEEKTWAEAFLLAVAEMVEEFVAVKKDVKRWGAAVAAMRASPDGKHMSLPPP